MGTLQKLKREGDSHLTDKDRNNIKDLLANMREYIYYSLEIAELLRAMYQKQDEYHKDKLSNANDLLNIDKVTNQDLEHSKVSKREFEQMKSLLLLDPLIFVYRDEDITESS